MKTKSILYIIGSIIVIGLATMKILHIKYANELLNISFPILIIIQVIYSNKLEKKIKQLESE